jgi:hypothetical protein
MAIPASPERNVSAKSATAPPAKARRASPDRSSARQRRWAMSDRTPNSVDINAFRLAIHETGAACAWSNA